MNCMRKKFPDKSVLDDKDGGWPIGLLSEDIGEWYLHKQMEESDIMTTDISKADFYFVNTMPVLSNTVGHCNGMDHNERQQYWKGILQSSTAFKLHPRRHAFICQTWYCQKILAKSLSNLVGKMTYLIHEKNTKWAFPAQTSQILTIPYVAHSDIIPFTTERLNSPKREHKVTFIGSMERRTKWRKPLSTLQRINVRDAGKTSQNFDLSYAEEMMVSLMKCISCALFMRIIYV